MDQVRRKRTTLAGLRKLARLHFVPWCEETTLCTFQSHTWWLGSTRKMPVSSVSHLSWISWYSNISHIARYSRFSASKQLKLIYIDEQHSRLEYMCSYSPSRVQIQPQSPFSNVCFSSSSTHGCCNRIGSRQDPSFQSCMLARFSKSNHFFIWAVTVLRPHISLLLTFLCSAVRLNG